MENDIYMPDNLLKNDNLSPREKIITVVLLNHYNCKTNYRRSKIVTELSTKLNITKGCVKERLKSISKVGFIKFEIKNKKQIKQILCDKNLKNKGDGDKICEWCGIKTYHTVEHHYPTPKNKGGKETVEICGSCHNEFHYFPVFIVVKNSPIKKKINKAIKNRR